MKKQKIYFFLCIAALFLSGISCNSTEDDVISYTVSESVRVSGFSLAANDSVLAHLDTSHRLRFIWTKAILPRTIR